MKTLLLLIPLLLLFAVQSFAGEAAVQAQFGHAWLLDPGDAPTTLPGLGAGVSYRPSYVDTSGAERKSDLLFYMSVTPNPDQTYGSVMGEYRFITWQGMDWFVGPGLGMLQETGGIYSLGAVGELRCDFNVGANPMFFTIGAGYIWRTPTPENPDPANVPFTIALGVRTQ